MSCRVLINYRREDSLGSAGRLYDRLVDHFSREHVFMDVDTIEPGVDFVEAIEKAVEACDVFLAIIGPDWLTTEDNMGQRRLENPDDFVRIEIAAALKRNIRVIPVLVKNAVMPKSTDLPEDLQSLVRRNAIEISHPRFDIDADRLIKAIERAFQQIDKKNKSTKKAGTEHIGAEQAPKRRQERSKHQSEVSQGVMLEGFPQQKPSREKSVRNDAQVERLARESSKSKRLKSGLVLIIGSVVSIVVLLAIFYVGINWDELFGSSKPRATEQGIKIEKPVEEPIIEKPVEEPVEELPEEIDPEIMGIKLSELKGTNVTFWYYIAGTGTDAKENSIHAIIDEFNATNGWDIKVDAVFKGSISDINDAMNAAVLTGDLPDAILSYSFDIASWNNAGVITDLQPFVSNPIIGLSASDFADFYSGSFESGITADGIRIAIPFYQAANVLFYNLTWAQELGFDEPPNSITEFKEQACAATLANATDSDSNNDGTGGLVWNSTASNVFSFIFAFGDDGLTEDGTTYDFTSQAVQDSVSMIKSIWDEGCAFQVDYYPIQEFASRQALFIMSSTSGIPYQLYEFDGSGRTDDWVCIPFVGSYGEKAIDVWPISLAMIDSTPKQNLATWLFFKHLTSIEAQATWIIASDYYPARESTMNLIEVYTGFSPQWRTGLDLLEYGQSEPTLASWGITSLDERSVRYQVANYMDMIIQGDAEDIMMYLEELDAAAAELSAGID